MTVAPFETTVMDEERVPTGDTVRRLKDGIYFDETTGKCYLREGAKHEYRGLY